MRLARHDPDLTFDVEITPKAQWDLTCTYPVFRYCAGLSLPLLEPGRIYGFKAVRESIVVHVHRHRLFPAVAV